MKMCSLRKFLLCFMMAMNVDTRNTKNQQADLKLAGSSSLVTSRPFTNGANHVSILRRLSRSTSRYHVVKKTVNRAVLVGSNQYIPCLMKNPIGWLKEDYILYMDSMTMYDSEISGEGEIKH